MRLHVVGKPRLAKDGEDWVLVLERTLEHPREEVWAALTEAGEIPKWGPFAPDRDLTAAGTVRLAHINMPEAEEMQGEVLEAASPHLLVFRWGSDILRWELSDGGDGNTVLVLRHRFADREQAPSYAAGWHLCLEGLAGTLAGKEMPSMVGHNAYQYGYQELYDRYAAYLFEDEGGDAE
jgi:uncharacterized protein YndB with AHSA1/START domain